MVLVSASTAHKDSDFNLQPFKVDLAHEFPRLKSLVQNTRLPTKALYPGTPDKGIQLKTVRDLTTQWTTTFNWEEQQKELNKFKHFTAEIEGQTVHFIHERSKDPDAIPIILLHGWPGSFHEFVPVIKPLTQSVKGADGKSVSYHVIVPSLPGFVFSSPPPLNWTNHDTARIFNTLMTQVLSYPIYAVHGTDWGSVVGYAMYSSFNTTVRTGQFVFLPFIPPAAKDISDANVTLTEIEKVALQRSDDWAATGNAYFMEQATKPNDIGLALLDNPVGQLAWIGTKFKDWSDPRAGTSPSELTNTAILTSVSLYFLTDSFLSSVWIYAQNPNGFATVYTKASTDAPLLFSQYAYNIGFWPREWVEKAGNLVSYKVHDFGGHFPGLDNPPALIEDIRQVAQYFTER
ncbi:epoxide hydrolase domain protein [Favolaschia claudopus]|uniref:Epoxide hydrolase domain protein n=1 Tax=Favolaschia claudopus TaxID=2862362 RepID=A0AAW0A3S7_9AGAR